MIQVQNPLKKLEAETTQQITLKRKVPKVPPLVTIQLQWMNKESASQKIIALS